MDEVSGCVTYSKIKIFYHFADIKLCDVFSQKKIREKLQKFLMVKISTSLAINREVK